MRREILERVTDRVTLRPRLEALGGVGAAEACDMAQGLLRLRERLGDDVGSIVSVRVGVRVGVGIGGCRVCR